MSTFPDFFQYGYSVEKELGHNRAGGRVTYLALDAKAEQQVVIKQFQFAKTGSSWSDYDAYDREIQLLKDLNHPGIPRYLDSFHTADGFCMVQEYKPAISLSESRSFNPDNIKQIAIAALEILVYLQNRIPPVIHRDIKPANILVSDASSVYLVDFGFAHIGEGEVGVSSVVKGTLGFMPPEQLFNRQLTEASDLYGLGMTLICLLTGTTADRIGDLVDISYRVSFKHLVPKLNAHWVNWLEKMVEPRLKDRFPNAVTALAAVPVSPLRPPEAQFSQSNVELRAARLGELLTYTVVITNPIPDTILEGHWEMAPHPNDPSRELFRWISVTPSTFVDNQVDCQITVDTRKLMACKTYHRRLLLQTNTLAKTYSLNLLIQTAPVPVDSTLLPYGMLSLLGLFSLGISWMIAWIVLIAGAVAESSGMAGFGAVVGGGIGLELAAWLMRSSGWRVGSTASTLAALSVGAVGLMRVLAGSISATGPVIIVGAVTGMIGGAIAGIALGTIVEKLIAQGQSKGRAIAASLLTTTLGTSVGLGLATTFAHPLILTLLVVSSLVLFTAIANLHLRRMQTLFSHSKSERYLIKP